MAFSHASLASSLNGPRLKELVAKLLVLFWLSMRTVGPIVIEVAIAYFYL